MSLPKDVFEAIAGLDMEWARKNGPQGLSDQARLIGMHKVRAECLEFHPEIRHASVEWLRERGFHLRGGRELPPPGELPS